MNIQVAIGKEKGKTIWRNAEATIRNNVAYVVLPHPYGIASFKRGKWRNVSKRGKRANKP
jgi:hypothetical protein